jgi:hypothetical protein
MLLALTGALMPSPITHLIGHFAILHDKGFLTPVMVAMFLAAGAVYDRFKLSRIHPVSLWIALAIFLRITYALRSLCRVLPGMPLQPG